MSIDISVLLVDDDESPWHTNCVEWICQFPIPKSAIVANEITLHAIPLNEPNAIQHETVNIKWYNAKRTDAKTIFFTQN